jgi:hypothetical protein
MPPGTIADINSFSARQRDTFWSARVCALIRIKACDRATDFVLRGLGAGRPASRRTRLMAVLAGPQASSCISTPVAYRVLFVERP